MQVLHGLPLAPLGIAKDPDVLRRKDDHELTHAGPHAFHGVGHVVQQALRSVAGAVGKLHGGKDGENGYSVVVQGPTTLNVERLPGAGFLVLGHTHTVFAALAQGGFVQNARCAAGDIHVDQANCPPDGGVGPNPRTEDVDARVDVQLFGDGAADNDELGGAPGAGLAAMIVEIGFAHGLDDGYQHRHVFGPAARHNRVDGNFFGRDDPSAGGHHADHIAWRPPGMGQKLEYPLLGGGDHGQPIGPALIVVELDGIVQTRYVYPFRCKAFLLHDGPRYRQR